MSFSIIWTFPKIKARNVSLIECCWVLRLVLLKEGTSLSNLFHLHKSLKSELLYFPFLQIRRSGKEKLSNLSIIFFLRNYWAVTGLCHILNTIALPLHKIMFNLCVKTKPTFPPPKKKLQKLKVSWYWMGTQGEEVQS